MTIEQIVAIGAAMAFNGIIVGIAVLRIKASLSAVNQRLDAMNQRFDAMKDLWRAELRRIEEVLDARLKHLKESE